MNPFKSLRFYLHIVLLSAVAFAFCVVIYGNLNKIFISTKEIGEIEAKIAEQNQISVDIQHDKDMTETDSYIEKVAREHLGLVKPDEIIFIKK